jgi:hypothetical protein
LEKVIYEDIDTNFDDKNSRIKKDQIPSIKKELDTHFDLLVILALDNRNSEILYSSFFENYFIKGIFGGKINSLGKESVLEIRFIEGSTVVVDIGIEDDRVKYFKYNPPLLKTDATLIETPTIFSLNKLVESANYDYLMSKDFPISYYDLLMKMKTDNEESPPAGYPDLMDEINEIVGGHMEFDAQEQAFIFRRKNQQNISSDSLATGIKSFAILQMLNQNEQLTEDTILILDEPEVHLHPEWEIVYAKLLFALCEAGVYVLLTTHSAYFIQSIIKYASDNNINDRVHFYFGDKKDDKSIFTSFADVTLDLNPIFKALSKQMRDIYM